MASIISAGTTSATALNMSADTTGVLQLASNNGTVALTVGTSQNVGVGTSSPSYKLDVSASVSSNFVARVINNSGSTSSDNALLVETSTASGARIISARNAGSEKFYVTGAGDVVVNNTFQFNSGYGSAATAYGCRAWVNFNGQSTPSIRSSGNVTSVTKNSTGNYTINLTTAMPDANYSVVGSKSNITATHVLPGVNMYASNTSTVIMQVYEGNGTFQDSSENFVAVFR